MKGEVHVGSFGRGGRTPGGRPTRARSIDHRGCVVHRPRAASTFDRKQNAMGGGPAFGAVGNFEVGPRGPELAAGRVPCGTRPGLSGPQRATAVASGPPAFPAGTLRSRRRVRHLVASRTREHVDRTRCRVRSPHAESAAGHHRAAARRSRVGRGHPTRRGHAISFGWNRLRSRLHSRSRRPFRYPRAEEAVRIDAPTAAALALAAVVRPSGGPRRCRSGGSTRETVCSEAAPRGRGRVGASRRLGRDPSRAAGRCRRNATSTPRCGRGTPRSSRRGRSTGLGGAPR